MKSPAFSFYVRDWLCSNTVSKLHSKSYSKDGGNLLSRGLGCYIFLLSQAWLQEPRATLPNDDAELADLGRVSHEEWVALKPLIMPAFKLNTEGRLFNDRQMEEADKQAKRKVAGSIGGSKKVANGVAALEDAIEVAFNSFWVVYPRKVAKQDAYKAWCKIPDVQLKLTVILASVELQKKSDQWKKDGGQFIPHPTTWLNQGRWDDEPVQLGVQKRDPHVWIIGNGKYTATNPPQRSHFNSEQSFQTHFEAWKKWKAKLV